MIVCSAVASAGNEMTFAGVGLSSPLQHNTSQGYGRLKPRSNDGASSATSAPALACSRRTLADQAAPSDRHDQALALSLLDLDDLGWTTRHFVDARLQRWALRSGLTGKRHGTLISRTRLIGDVGRLCHRARPSPFGSRCYPQQPSLDPMTPERSAFQPQPGARQTARGSMRSDLAISSVKASEANASMCAGLVPRLSTSRRQGTRPSAAIFAIFPGPRCRPCRASGDRQTAAEKPSKTAARPD